MSCSRHPFVALILLAVAAGFGCASAGVTETRQYAEESEVAKPSVVLVYDFSTTAADVMVDTRGPKIIGGDGTHAEKDELSRQVAKALSESLVEQLGERGIQARRADAGTLPPLNALLVKGRFLTMDEGDRTSRVVVGFGAGSSELRIVVEVFQATASGVRPLSEAQAEASGSKMPGLAIPVAGGAAAGTAAVSATISGVMNVTREARGGLEADAARLAEKIADRAKAFYERRGWL